MSRLRLGSTAFVLLSLSVLSCSDGEAGTQAGECSTFCGDGCQQFRLERCPSVDPQELGIICINHVEYHCKTPENGYCCEGYGTRYLPSGDCDTNTPGCTDPADGDDEIKE